MIGSREVSAHAEKFGRRVSSRLAQQGWCIVSGIATGCDTVGHLGALNVGGKTVAIMPTGLDKIYPKKNEGLANDIVAAGGCLISEYLPHASVSKGSFVERDRQSGLSKVLRILETKNTSSGTMHTVRFWEKEGRVIAALRFKKEGGALPENYGNQVLIEQERAIAVESLEDVDELSVLAGGRCI